MTDRGGVTIVIHTRRINKTPLDLRQRVVGGATLK